MNELNVCTLPAAQRLAEKGIVLETECVWAKQLDTQEYFLVLKDLLVTPTITIPAPSMAEVWRELPDILPRIGILIAKKYNGLTYTEYVDLHFGPKSPCPSGHNPTDALVELLIFVVEQKGKK